MAEREPTVGRTAQHAVHVLPHAEFAMARILEPALDRITADADATQLLVITADTDTAIAMAAISRSLRDRSVAPLVAISAAGRGARLLGSRVVPALAGTPGTVMALLRSSAVKLDGVSLQPVATFSKFARPVQAIPAEAAQAYGLVDHVIVERPVGPR